MAELLSRGVLRSILEHDQTPESFVVQIVDIKSVNSRIRVLLTDGTQQAMALLTSNMNNMVNDGLVVNNSIVRIGKIQTSDVQTSKVIIIFEWEVLQKDAAPVSSSAAAPVNIKPAPQLAPASNVSAPPYGSYGAPAAPSYGNATVAYGVPPSVPSYGSIPASNPYGQPAGAPYQQQVPSASMVDAYANYNTASRGAPVVKDNTVGKNIVPISFLNPYSSKWTIKARITSKGEIRRWSNARGEGTLFSIDLLDAGGDEIRGTFFKDACDKFYPILEEGKVYLFSDGIVKAVQNRQYSHLISDFEITFNKQSEIIAAADDVEIKSQHFKFVKIDAIPFHDPNTTIDVIAVVKSAADVAELTSQKMGNKQLKKRDVTLIDDSGSEIKLTLWGDRAVANYDWASRPIVAFKGVKVGDYGGRSLSTTQSTGITLNPQIPEGARLNQYAMSFPNREIPAGVSLSNQAGGAGAGNADTVERRKTTSSIKDEGLGNQEKPDYITIKATTTYIKHDNDCWYTACPTPNCNKKVTETLGNNSMWRCEKCRADFPNCHYRYILSAMVSDHSGGTWVSLFNDTAEKMLGVTAEHLAMLRKEGRERDTEQIFTDALFKTYLMRLRVKSEFVNDERRVKSSVMKLDSIDFVSESRMLLEAIDRYN